MLILTVESYCPAEPVLRVLRGTRLYDVADVDARLRAEQLREPLRHGAAALDHVDDALAAQGPQRRPDRHTASAPGELGCPRHGVPRAFAELQIGRLVGIGAQRRGMAGGVRGNREPGVVGSGEPLVRVHGPGVGTIDPVGLIA